MTLFIDTSGFYSLLDASDKNHIKGRSIWQRILDEDANLVTSNYIIVETTALIQNRLGMHAVADLQNSILPLIQIEWVTQFTHQAGMAAMLTANRRQLSLVDCVSFELCRQLNIKEVFAFDKHFEEQGFRLL